MTTPTRLTRLRSILGEETQEHSRLDRLRGIVGERPDITVGGTEPIAQSPLPEFEPGRLLVAAGVDEPPPRRAPGGIADILVGGDEPIEGAMPRIGRTKRPGTVEAMRAYREEVPPPVKPEEVGVGPTGAAIGTFLAQLRPGEKQRDELLEEFYSQVDPEVLSQHANLLGAEGALGTAAREMVYMRVLGPVARLGGAAIRKLSQAERAIAPKLAAYLDRLAYSGTGAARTAKAVESAAAGTGEAATFGAARETLEHGPEAALEGVKYAPYGTVLGGFLGALTGVRISPSRAVASPRDVAEMTQAAKEARRMAQGGRVTPEQEVQFARRILGLADDATEAQLDAAIRTKSNKYHPDSKKPGATPDAELMKVYNEAATVVRRSMRPEPATETPGRPTEPRPPAEEPVRPSERSVVPEERPPVAPEPSPERRVRSQEPEVRPAAQEPLREPERTPETEGVAVTEPEPDPQEVLAEAQRRLEEGEEVVRPEPTPGAVEQLPQEQLDIDYGTTAEEIAGLEIDARTAEQVLRSGRTPQTGLSLRPEQRETLEKEIRDNRERIGNYYDSVRSRFGDEQTATLEADVVRRLTEWEEPRSAVPGGEPTGRELTPEEVRERVSGERDPVTGALTLDPMDRPTFERRKVEQGPPPGVEERRAEVQTPESEYIEQPEPTPEPEETTVQPAGRMRAAWQMPYNELRQALAPSDRQELERARPLLAEVFPEELTNATDPWGIRRAIERGDELPRTPTTDLSQRHRALIEDALRRGEDVPASVLVDYEDLTPTAEPTLAEESEVELLTAEPAEAAEVSPVAETTQPQAEAGLEPAAEPTGEVAPVTDEEVGVEREPTEAALEARKSRYQATESSPERTPTVSVGAHHGGLDRLQQLHRELRAAEEAGDELTEAEFNEREVELEERVDSIQDQIDKFRLEYEAQYGGEALGELDDAVDEWARVNEIPVTAAETVEPAAETGPIVTAGTESPETAIDATTVSEEVAAEQPPTRSGEELDDMVQQGRAVRVGGTETGAVDAQAVNKGIRAFLRRNFTAPGDLPKRVFDRMIKRDGGVNSRDREVAHTLRKFRRVARRAYGTSKLSDEQQRQINAALQGEPINMPDEMRSIVKDMRGQIDALSQLLIESGAIAEHLVPVIDANRGVYLTRSYKAFDDPKFWQNVSEDVKNRVRSLLASEMPDASPEQLEGEFQRILRAGELSDSPLDFLVRGSKLGSKNLSILKRRKAIAPEIRALWGEYTDPLVNYVRSVTKMSQLLENHKFLADVLEGGLGEYFFEEPVVRDGVSYVKKFAAEGSRALEPLNGFYTSPEVDAAFHRAVETEVVSDWLRHYMKVNGVVKYAKTIGSVMTHVRNTTGNTGFAIANGHWDISKMPDAARTVWGDLWDVGLKDKEEWQGIYREMVELGVVHESARAGELWDAVNDAVRDPEAFIKGNVVQRSIRKILKGVTSVYRAEDDVWKLYAFANEFERYRNAKPDWTDQRVKERAAEIVRNTYPTYSLVPHAIKKIRRFPLVGTFVSFPWEVIRTLGNTLQLTAGELNDPDLHRVGAQRIAGLLLAATTVSAVAYASRFLNGIDDDTDERVRRFVPPWSENSSLVYLGRGENGRVRYIDLSYTDPYSYLRTPLKAMMRGENWHDGLIDGFFEALEPFVSEEILASKLLDVKRNKKKDSGAEVYNPEDPFDKQATAILSYVYDAFEPGTVSGMRRIWRGITNDQTLYGRSYNPVVEGAAMFTGFRMQELDVPQALSWNAREAVGRWSNATRILSSTASRAGDVSDSELQEAYESMERTRQKVFANVTADMEAARKFGMKDEAIKRVLRGSGLSETLVMQLIDHNYVPYQPSDRFLEYVSEARQSTSTPEKAREVRERYADRREFLQQLAEDALEESGAEITRPRSRRPRRRQRR